jgi:hypothetical protein
LGRKETRDTNQKAFLEGWRMMNEVSPNPQKLLAIRIVHTVVYVLMAASIVFIMISGITGGGGSFLIISFGLVAIEVIVFVASGMKCPLTGLARKYGAPKGYAFDTLLPELIAKNTFRAFGTLLALGLVLHVLRWVHVI